MMKNLPTEVVVVALAVFLTPPIIWGITWVVYGIALGLWYFFNSLPWPPGF